MRGREAASTFTEISPVWEVVSTVKHLPMPLLAGGPFVLGRDALFRRLLATSDVVAAYLGLLFAVLFVASGRAHMRPAAILLGPLVVLVGKAIGLYERDQYTLRKTTVDELPSILHLSVICALGVWLAERLIFHGALLRAQVFALVLANLAFVFAGRSLTRAILLTVTPAERCIVLGNASDAERTANKLASSPGVKATVLGRVSLHSEGERRSSHGVALGDVGSLASVVNEHAVERVIIAPDSDEQDEVLHAIRLIKALGVKVSVLPRLLEVVGSSSIFDEVDGLTLLGVRHYGLSRSSESLKRTMDLFIASIALVLLAPLMLMMALAIKIDSPGPVYFRQSRIGRRGEGFSMLKFRSMVVGADQMKDRLREDNEAEGGLFKITDDPRTTSVGRFLRQTSLDELAQLLNVLKGDMSLVGPRPLVPDEDALIEGWQRRRLAVRPGVTGLWQVFGSSRIPMSEMVKIDYLYGANWSIWADLKILLRTIPYVLRRRGL